MEWQNSVHPVYLRKCEKVCFLCGNISFMGAPLFSRLAVKQAKIRAKPKQRLFHDQQEPDYR